LDNEKKETFSYLSFATHVMTKAQKK